jgi:transposase
VAREFLPYDLDQHYLLPPDLREWLPAGHLVWFVSDVVDSLDLSAVLAAYEKQELRGRPGYDPTLLVKLLLYAYCVGKPSSRRIERATYEEVPFRVLAAGQHPDHASIAAFRRRHLPALAGLFLQVLLLCRKAGLARLGHVALDGTKVRASASRHKAMSYARLCSAEEQLTAEVEALLAEAERVDAEEDALYGAESRGEELPRELQRRESRLAKIRAAKEALEREAKERAELAAEGARERLRERKAKEAARGKRFGGRPPRIPDPQAAKPGPREQKNFTDPESRIMMDGATKSFVRAYNAHAAVDAHSQIIVAASLTQEANDKQQLRPLLAQLAANLGRLPKQVSADSGFFSADNLTDPALAAVELYVPPEKRVQSCALADVMRAKLATEEGAALYAQRKAVVEPVFGQVKEVRGLRRFSLRGLKLVGEEWQLVCLTHNLLKLFRSGAWPLPA